MISAELATFLQSGVSLLVGTRDADLVPESLRAVGARVEPGGAEVTVYLPVATSARALANLRDNGRLAVCFSRPLDHRSVQLKGAVVALRDGVEADRRVVERYRALLTDVLAAVGVPPRITLQITHWPVAAARFRVESVFVQTPGPGAGAPLGASGAAERRP